MAAKIEERFHVGMYKARRVVRTESNYCINQAELKGMKDAGFDEYEFISLGENAENVCDTCDDLDGQRFKISDATVGVNFPPMHPFCRCKATTPMETLEDIQADIDRMLGDMSIEELEQRLDMMIEEKEALPESDSTEENSLNLLTSGENGDKINGRGSGTFDYPVYNAEDCWSEQLGRIEITDSRQIVKTLGDFENNYRGSSVEHCIVISKSGDVYVVHGGPINVHPEILGEDVLRGIINEHNHIPEATQHSFGKDDFINSSTDGTSMALACDEKYRYYMRFSREYTDMEASHAYKNATDSVDNDCEFYPDRVPEGDEQHERIKRACEELGIEYGRNEIS